MSASDRRGRSDTKGGERMTRVTRDTRTGRDRRESGSSSARPMPDEAPLEDEARPRSDADAGVTDLSSGDWLDVVKRAGRNTIEHNMPMIAQALAFSTFMAVPAVLLVTLGVFTLVAGPQTITSLMNHFGAVMPDQATQLLGDSLSRLSRHRSAGVTMTIVGFVLALWSTTGAMTSY